MVINRPSILSFGAEIVAEINGIQGDDPSSRWPGWVFPDGKARTLVFQVRKNSLTVSVDGTPLIQGKGDLAQVRNDYGMADKSSLFLCAWIQYSFSKIELQSVTGSGRPLR